MMLLPSTLDELCAAVKPGDAHLLRGAVAGGGAVTLLVSLGGASVLAEAVRPDDTRAVVKLDAGEVIHPAPVPHVCRCASKRRRRATAPPPPADDNGFDMYYITGAGRIQYEDDPHAPQFVDEWKDAPPVWGESAPAGCANNGGIS